MIYWQGQLLNEGEFQNKLENLHQHVAQVVSKTFNFEAFRIYCGNFSVELKSKTELFEKLHSSLVNDDQLSPTEAHETLQEIADFLNQKNLQKKLERELGSAFEFSFRRQDARLNIFERWAPVGFLVHILPGNAPSVPVLAAIEGLLCGNFNFVKLSSSSSSFAIHFFEEFFKKPDTQAYRERLVLAPVSSKDKKTLKKVLTEADAVSAWGNEETLAEVKSMTPSRARFIDWGHKISFHYLTQRAVVDENLLKSLADDLLALDQQACSSPQCLFLEDANEDTLSAFASKFAEILNQKTAALPPLKLSDNEAAELTRVTELQRTRAALGYAEVLSGPHASWRLLLDNKNALSASPLFRTLWVRPLKKENLFSTLWPLRTYLQSVGLAAHRDEIADRVETLTKAGVLRIRQPGQMLASYSGEAHDGVYALSRFLRRITLDLGSNLKGISDLADLSERYSEAPRLGPIMKKSDFVELHPSDSDSDLFFKSGGSSGVPKISIFTYGDYHLQMRAAADGLVAAGLDPRQDRCMNLFYGGGLYGGFLSFFTILEFLRAKQFPMAAHDQMDFVIDTIHRFGVNTLLGMPSYLAQLFERGHERFKNEGVVKKIFYGGEAFNQRQREHFSREYGVELIRSASYGSVDAGPLGFQCPHSQDGIHHLQTELQYLEILEIDSEKSVKGTQSGRLIVSSKHRQGQRIERYEIGDLGRWVPGPCPCGRSSPRFELLGRFGDIFKAGGSFLNYNKFQDFLRNYYAYPFETQILLDKQSHLDTLTLRLDQRSQAQLEPKRLVGMLIEQYADLKEVLDEKLLKFSIDFVSAQDFSRSPSSGKLQHVIDRRGLQ